MCRFTAWSSILLLPTAGAIARPVFGQATAQPTTVPATQVATLHTFDPRDFQESRIDRLSGGLTQQIPFRMVADSQGRILVTDPFLSLVHVFDTKTGRRWQINGDHLQRMNFPTYVAVDADDNIYVSEPLDGIVKVFTPDGHYLRTIGGPDLYVPFGLAIDKVGKKLYVADHYRDKVLVYSLDGQLLKTIGSRGTGAGELIGPCDIALHHGMLFVLDRGNARFQFFDQNRNSNGAWPFGDNRSPISFALDPAGNLYAIDMQSLGLVVLDPAGNPVGYFDVVRPYGQPKAVGQYPSLTSLQRLRMVPCWHSGQP